MASGDTAIERAPTRRLERAWRRFADSQPSLFLGFVCLALLVTLLETALPSLFPVTSMVIVAMVGGFMLRVRSLLLLYLVITSGTLFALARIPAPGLDGWALASYWLSDPMVLLVACVLVLLFARSREQLGVQGTLGSSMLVDLRDRIREQGLLVEELPDGWRLESAIRSANGDSFSGDFLVLRGPDRAGGMLELVLVDVSGKGARAGSRALMLSAAFGGLLGAMPRARFLPAANDYLLRQEWSEGFATAVHVALDPSSGKYWLSSAGHPPAMHFHAGSGQWELLTADSGVALGVLVQDAYPVHHGELARGDALLLYTDGMVETPGRDLDLGIDRLMGLASRLVSRDTFSGGADWVVDTIKAQDDDDRSMLLLWRD